MRPNPCDSLSPPSFPSSRREPLELVVSRGEAVESVHHVHALVVDREKKMVSSWGDQSKMLFPRSTIKALQALPLLLEGHASRWSLGPEHLALACGSHYGEEHHTTAVESWLGRIGLSEADLECGPHLPFSEAASRGLLAAGNAPCRIHNNCSGKHAGLLTGCVSRSLKTSGYSDYSHPYQQKQRELLGGIFGLEMDKQPWGIDGCGIPTYAMPLGLLAQGLAVCAGAVSFSREVSTGMEALNRAIREKPEFLEGAESVCTQISLATKGAVIAKSGAEGVFAAWAPEAGLAVVLKCEDGAERAAELSLIQLLQSLGFDLSPLSETFILKNWSGEPVGRAYCR
jgi:L-asparaginase II